MRLAALADDVWAEDNPGSEQLLVQAASRAGFEPRIELEAGDLLGKVGLVAAGLAVALAPGLLAPSLPGNVRLLRLVDPPTRAVYAVRRADRGSPVADALVEALTATAGGGLTAAQAASSSGSSTTPPGHRTGTPSARRRPRCATRRCS